MILASAGCGEVNMQALGLSTLPIYETPPPIAMTVEVKSTLDGMDEAEKKLVKRMIRQKNAWKVIVLHNNKTNYKLRADRLKGIGYSESEIKEILKLVEKKKVE